MTSTSRYRPFSRLLKGGKGYCRSNLQVSIISCNSAYFRDQEVAPTHIAVLFTSTKDEQIGNASCVLEFNGSLRDLSAEKAQNFRSVPARRQTRVKDGCDESIEMVEYSKSSRLSLLNHTSRWIKK
jgi:hypothetical protein